MTQKAETIILRGATIIDGTGAPARTGDVKVVGDRIVGVGRAGAASGAEASGATADALELDCSGLVVAPGFIDIHSHSDFSLFLDPGAPNYVAQGVTLLVNGNCGTSGAPIDAKDPLTAQLIGDERILRLITWSSFAEYMETLDRLPKAVNLATFVGHVNARVTALGVSDRRPDDRELEVMKAVVREAMSAGAFGLSTGLIYPPGVFAATEELIELARVVAEVAGDDNGLYASHLRSESDQLLEAVQEAVRIGQASRTRVQISHHKAAGRRNWGLVRTSLDLMEDSRRQGVEVTCDVYPCVAGATGLLALFPSWTHQRGKDGFMAFLKDPEARARIKREVSRPMKGSANLLFDAGLDGVRVADSRVFPQYLGKSLADIARAGGVAPAPAAGADPAPADPLDVLLELAERDFDLGITLFSMSEADVRYVLAHRLSCVGADAAVPIPGEGLPHPRTYRAFTRTLATYARDERVITLEQAIHKMTGFPAWKLGLPDRGVVRPGAKADLAVFDLWGLRAGSDFDDPHHLSEGMVHVLVNGEFVIRDGKMTGAKPGALVRRPA